MNQTNMISRYYFCNLMTYENKFVIKTITTIGIELIVYNEPIFIIQIRPPKDFGPKAQNLEGVRICLRKCGTDIIHSKK